MENNKLEINKVNKVISKPFKGSLHSYTNSRGYEQTVTPNHRMLVYKHNSRESIIKKSEEIFDVQTPYNLPTKFAGSMIPDADISDDMIMLAAMIYADGNFDFRPNGSIHKVKWYKSPRRWGQKEFEDICDRNNLIYTKKIKNGFGPIAEYTFYGDSARDIVDLCTHKHQISKIFFELSERQARLFLETWMKCDGDIVKNLIQCDDESIFSSLQHISILAGYTSYKVTKRKTLYIKLRQYDYIIPSKRVEEPYDGLVWCPNVNNGTAIFRRNNNVFISGQTQAPFTNITLDWTVPNDLAELNAIVGGKEMDFKYKDCKKEMDMVNKAFIEIMIEGDAHGRGFQYPIPTYSITRDFDWSETENNKLLFEMTAKYGTPYFSNYINSDMEPSDVRSMAILGTQNLIYKDKFGRVSKNEVRHLVHNWINNPETQYSVLMNGKFVDIIDMFEVPYEKYNKYVEIKLENGITQKFSYDHKCIVVRNGKITEVLAQDIAQDDKILLGAKSFSESNIGTYEAGKIIGYYLAEGWTTHNDKELDFAINDNREDICQEIQRYFNDNFAARVSIEHWEDKHIYKIKVFSGAACSFVKKYISGNRALEKHIECYAYDTSDDFRYGIYDGYLATDGSEKNKVFAHTTNKHLCQDMIELFATIGKYFKYQVNNNNTRYFKPDKSDLETFTSYKLYLYEPEVFNDEYFCVGVTGIELKDAKRINTVYNFTVNTKEHLYELPNGIITHQCCRLRLDLRELRKKSGGFFGSGESTGCYDEKTEILTQNRGWIPFKELTLDDYIYTRNNVGEIEIHNPTRLFKYEYKDKLYHFNNSKFDALVTPNHKMVYTDKHTNEQYFVRADEYKHTKHGIPRKAKNLKQDKKIFVLPSIENSWITGNYESEHKKIWTDKYISMETWLKFLGLFISEGSTDNEDNAKTHGYRVSISQVKEFGKEYIESVLKEMPFKYYHDNKDYVICDKQLWHYCRYSVGTDCYCKRIPREILKECSSDELNNLLEALIVGDGSINSNSGQITYYSSSKGLMDDIQELLMLTNHAVTGIRKREPRDSIIGDRKILAKNCNICYEITISRCEKFYLMPENISQEDYEGYVYCCEVPNHTLMVRRNNKATWCGNSVGVVTINMPRIAYLAEDKEDFYKRLDKLMDIAAKSLDMKRTVITKLLENGLYPYTKRYLGTFNNHFSTIGLVGMNEAGLNAKWLRKDMTHKETQDFSVEVLNHMRERLSDYQEKYGDLFNLEATPAESTSYRLAKHDKEAYPDIITANENGTPYYTNSSHLPVGYSEDIFSALDVQDELQTLYTSGTVFHAFLGEKLPDWKAAATLVRKIAENYRLPYYTMSPTYSVCKDHGYINGEQYTCPICGEKTEVYSRITGYYRPVQNWNDGKTQEFKDRVVYDISKSHLNKQMVIDEYVTNENVSDNNIEEKKIYLFATPTCPNCKIACADLEKNGIAYEKIYANENPEMCKEFEIKQAPTLVIIENSEIKKFTGVSDIRRFIRS